MRAATERGLRYGELKTSARNGIQYSFLPGASLWAGRPGGAKVAGCQKDSPICESLLKSNTKAAMEAGLEREYVSFEAKAAAGGFQN